MSPEQIKATAFHSQSDEYAWQRPHIAKAIEALADQGCAILGGEVWIVKGSDILALPPLRSGGNAVIGWDITDKESDEGWNQFVERTAKESLAAIESLNAENEVLPEAAPNVFYNLTFVKEEEYSKLLVTETYKRLQLTARQHGSQVIFSV
jgi:hypothetical protein